MPRQTLQQRMEERIAASEDTAFLTREFADLGSERNVLRVLRKLTDDGKLVRLGHGVYGRTVISSLTGEPILDGPGFRGVTRQALTKLGVAWEPTRFERLYNEGRSNQIPVNAVVWVKGRFSRKLRYKELELVISE